MNVKAIALGPDFTISRVLDSACSVEELQRLWVREFPRNYGKPSIEGSAVLVCTEDSDPRTLVRFAFAKLTSSTIEVNCTTYHRGGLALGLVVVGSALLLFPLVDTLPSAIGLGLLAGGFFCWNRFWVAHAMLKGLQRLNAAQISARHR